MNAKNMFEDVIYVIICILSVGFVWLSRIIITKAIRDAEIAKKKK